MRLPSLSRPRTDVSGYQDQGAPMLARRHMARAGMGDSMTTVRIRELEQEIKRLKREAEWDLVEEWKKCHYADGSLK